MLAAWRRTSVKLGVPERMGITMSDAAVSITITSLTDIISFWIGIMSPFPSVQIFCKYSGMAVCFIFAWHITFFAACMAISGYCEEKNLHSIFGYKVKPVSVAIKGKHNQFHLRKQAIDWKTSFNSVSKWIQARLVCNCECSKRFSVKNKIVNYWLFYEVIQVN